VEQGYTWQDGALILRLWVQPKASRDQWQGLHNDHIKLQVTAPPVDGKANTHIQKFLAKTFGVAKSSITLKTGTSSRQKTFIIDQPRQLPSFIDPQR
tara:strand:- start:1524 stop:1814 length:291 start_codon:yes stop_codon:yes gene_type:complete